MSIWMVVRSIEESSTNGAWSAARSHEMGRSENVAHNLHRQRSDDAGTDVGFIKNDRLGLGLADDGDVRAEEASGLVAALADGGVSGEFVGKGLFNSPRSGFPAQRCPRKRLKLRQP